MPVFDTLQRASFDGLDFPVKSVSVKGRYRHEEHEYLRVPGAVIEKLERAVYNIEIQAVFDTNVKGYGRLWPDVLTAIRNKFETGVTSALTIPTVGTIPAFQPEWDQTADMGKLRSGEMVKLAFKEDQTQRFLTLALVQTQQQSMATSLNRLQVTRAQILGEPANDTSIFDAIQNTANGILAIKDRGDLYGGLLVAKLGQMTALMNRADSALESLKHPVNHEVTDAFLELWNTAVKMTTNLAESPRGPRSYTTPKVMSMGDVATAVYGDSTRASEILLNNTLDDPFAIAAGTKIIYFETAGLIAA